MTSRSLTYVSMLTEQGLLKVPNSSFLAAAVGPWPRHEAHGDTERLVTVGAGRVDSVQRCASTRGGADQSS